MQSRGWRTVSACRGFRQVNVLSGACADHAGLPALVAPPFSNCGFPATNAERLRPGLTPFVDDNRESGGSGRLNAMLLAPEVVGGIPVVGPGLAGYVLATLDVSGLHLLSAAAATDLGAHRASGDSATDRGDSLTASAADLMAENAAAHGTDQR